MPRLLPKKSLTSSLLGLSVPREVGYRPSAISSVPASQSLNDLASVGKKRSAVEMAVGEPLVVLAFCV